MCLGGRCYAQCSATVRCGPREECNAQGVCVESSVRVDGGRPIDGGPPDPCATAMCEGARPHCRGGACLECDEGMTELCGGAVTVCDVGRGNCVAYAPLLCGPCTTDRDCQDGAGVPVGRCTLRTTFHERVCLQACDGGEACPQGFACDGDVCQPVPLNSTCMGWRGAVDGLTCAVDADCAPVGADFDTGVFLGACADTGGGLVCRHPCGVESDCPAGRVCGADGFCRAP